MDDDTSNDVIAIEGNEDKDSTTPLESDQSENRPIMLLFRRLLSNDNKQNTVLTNAQIIDILEKEFKLNVGELHELEIDIYLNTVKKFLKDWPQWDELDGVVNRLKNINAYDSIKNILDHKYRNLKEYLRVMIEATKPIAQNTVKEVLSELSLQKDVKNDTSDVYMEICCTRPQLNKCFYRTPRESINKTIFNVLAKEQSRIPINTISLESILNWWSVRITVNLKFLYYKRETIHQLKHTLVNKVNGREIPKSSLRDELQIKIYKNPVQTVKREEIQKVCDSITQHYANKPNFNYLIETIFKLIKSDLEDTPEDVIVPASYKKYSNKYPYIRYLYSDVPGRGLSNPKHDLQLEEIISPMHQFTIEKIDKCDFPITNTESWLKIECLMCKVTFTAADPVENIKAHFGVSDCHDFEPMWTCTHCMASFAMATLAQNKWYHVC